MIYEIMGVTELSNIKYRQKRSLSNEKIIDQIRTIFKKIKHEVFLKQYELIWAQFF